MSELVNIIQERRSASKFIPDVTIDKKRTGRDIPASKVCSIGF